MLDYSTLPFLIEPMRSEDVEEVMAIERTAFAGAPWTASAYQHELTKNEMANYFVLRQRYASQKVAPGQTRRSRWRSLLPKAQAPPVDSSAPRPPILGYGGFWLMVDEAHISTIATAPAWRGKHLGELLLVALIEHARAKGAIQVTLEVRVSNTIAQNLYRKYRFSVEGRRRRYYSDNGEDALIMTTDRIDRPAFQTEFELLTQRLSERLRSENP